MPTVAEYEETLIDSVRVMTTGDVVDDGFPSGLLIYAACPSRLSAKKSSIMKLAARSGNACLHPFNAFPYNYFEGGSVGRQRTLDWCCRLIDACDELWLFGISDGTLFEVEYLLENYGASKCLRIFAADFDPLWRSNLRKLANRYPNAAGAVRGGRRDVGSPSRST